MVADEEMHWDLLARWEEDYRQGRDVPVEELCRDHPELAARLADSINSLKRMNWLLKPPADAEAVPTSIGEYTIKGRIGSGGMAHIYKAQDRVMDRLVAIKILSGRRASDPSLRRRFQQEVQSAARLQHPNIVTAFYAGEHENRPYLVMEYVAGCDLAQHVRERGPLPVDEVVGLILQAAKGLEYAHGKKIFHGDVKPANLLLSLDGTVKIADFGLARILSTDMGDEALVGTVDFLAPELTKDQRRADPCSDVYSLGCTLYFLLTGRPIYGAATTLQKIQAHREAPIPSLRHVRTDVGENLDALFQKMAAKQPEDRYRSMTEVAEALEALQIAAPPRAVAVSPSRVMRALIASIVAALVLGGVGIYLLSAALRAGQGKGAEGQEIVDDGLKAPAANGNKPAIVEKDALLFVSSEETNNVICYNARTGQPIPGAFIFSGHEGTLNHPLFLAEHEGYLYIANQNSENVLRFGFKEMEITTFIPSKRAGLSEPCGIAFGPDGHFYVSSRGDHSVKRYNGKTGTFIDNVVPSRTGGLSNPTGLTFGPDKKLYIADAIAHKIFCCDVENGNSLSTFVPARSGGLNYPTALSFGPDSNLYVCGPDTNSILRYDGRTGEFMNVFVEAGAGGLKAPTGLAFGPEGNLYVGCLRHNVLRYNGKTGAFMDVFVPPGGGGLHRPIGLLFTADFR